MPKATRRTLMSSEDRKVHVLERVTKAFAKKGFAGTRTADLAKAAGVSQALIYKLFGDKKGLYKAMIVHKLDEAQQGTLSVEAPAPGDDEGFFRQLALVILSRTQEDPDFPRLLLFSELEGASFASLFREMHSDQALGHLSAYIRQRIADGAFSDIDPDLAAWSFLGMVWQYALSAYVFKHPLVVGRDPETLADDFARIFLNGMRTSP